MMPVVITQGTLPHMKESSRVSPFHPRKVGKKLISIPFCRIRFYGESKALCLRGLTCDLKEDYDVPTVPEQQAILVLYLDKKSKRADDDDSTTLPRSH